MARLEGLEVELHAATEGFLDAAATHLREMEMGIIRDYPQFYSNEQREEAGVPPNWCSALYPGETISWWRYIIPRLEGKT